MSVTIGMPFTGNKKYMCANEQKEKFDSDFFLSGNS